MDWTQAQEELREIMGAKEYTDYARGQTPSLWDFLWGEFIKFLNGILPGNMAVVNMVAVVVLLIIAAAVIGGIVWVCLRMGRNVRAQERAAQGFLIVGKTWDQCLTEADAWAAQYNYALAIRSLFQGFILFLDQKEWIQLKAWKTNGQYLRELDRRQAQVAGEFAFVAGCFEDVVYGGRSPTADIYERCRNQAWTWMGKGADS